MSKPSHPVAVSRENVDLAGLWTGDITRLSSPDEMGFTRRLRVYCPAISNDRPILIGSFFGVSDDECIEQFGEWLDALNVNPFEQ